MSHHPQEIHQSDPSGCLSAFKAKVIDGLDEPGDPAKVGTILHKIAERLTGARAESPMVDVHGLSRDVLRAEALRIGLTPAGLVDAVEVLEAILSPGSRINLWPEMGWHGEAEHRWGLVLDMTKGDEGQFVYVADPKEPVYAAGMIDLVEWTPGEGLVRVTDWKTSRQMFGGDDAWESWQARLYAYAMLRRFPMAKSVEFRYGMLRHGYYSTPADFLRGDPWEWGVETRLRATHEQRERAMAANAWPETPGPWCAYCPVRWKCVEFTRLVAQGDEIPEDYSPVDVALTLGAMKSAVTDLKRRAEAIVEQTGRPIILDGATGLSLGYKPTQAWETVLPYEETMDRLRACGMTKAQEIEHFRFVQANHFPSRVRKVLREVLRVDAATAESVVVPIARSEFTVFTPERAGPADRSVTLEEIDDYLDRIL